MKILAYKTADWIPVASALAHAAYLGTMFAIFPYAPWWVLGVMGFVYSVSISWNINGIAHNFIHNPYFAWEPLNYAFSWLLSVTMGFSQQFYELVHNRHHQGNSDRQDENGDTVDWLSIYRHGHDGEPENVWSYVFCSYFRDDPKEIFNAIKQRKPFNARFGIFEIASWVCLLIAGFYFNWRFMLFYLPFYYFGHCLSYLNGFYLHYGSNPDLPIAWGVSSYHKLYNLIWFNNGYHAEHHFRPRQHWTEMEALRQKIKDEQARAGTHIIKQPHALGFLDPNQPKRKSPPRVEQSAAKV